MMEKWMEGEKKKKKKKNLQELIRGVIGLRCLFLFLFIYLLK